MQLTHHIQPIIKLLSLIPFYPNSNQNIDQIQAHPPLNEGHQNKSDSDTIQQCIFDLD